MLKTLASTLVNLLTLTKRKSSDEIKEVIKNPSGFYCLLDRGIESLTTKGYSNFAEALYMARRYWNKQPGTFVVSIAINKKILYQYDTVTKKEEFHMSEFSDFRKNYADESGHSMDSLPSLKKDERTVFIRAGIPFSLSENTGIVKSNYGTQIAYAVVVDQSSPEFKSVGKMMSIGSEYVLWVKATEGRVQQYNQIIRPLIDDKPDTLYCLIKPEGSKEPFDFERYVPGAHKDGVGFDRVYDDFDPFVDEDR